MMILKWDCVLISIMVKLIQLTSIMPPKTLANNGRGWEMRVRALCNVLKPCIIIFISKPYKGQATPSFACTYPPTYYKYTNYWVIEMGGAK